MEKFILWMSIMTLLFAVPTYAAIDSATDLRSTETEKFGSSNDVYVRVNGLVCDFCARALEKVFGKKDAVKAIDINLDTKVITISFIDGQSFDDETIIKLVTESGYNVEEIHRDK